MIYTLRGPIKPYVHRTYRGKYSERANEYHASQNVIRWQLKKQMQTAGVDIIPKGVPIRLRIDVTVPSNVGHKMDVTNIQKALEDSAQHVLFENDAWVDDVHTTRTIGDAWCVTLEVERI